MPTRSYVLTPIKHFTSPETPDDPALLDGLRFLHGTQKSRDVDYFEYLDEMPPIDFTQSHADLGLLMPQSQTSSFIGSALPRLTNHSRERSWAIARCMTSIAATAARYIRSRQSS